MASCDGAWNIAMDTPIGNQTLTLMLASDGNELSGRADTAFGSQEFDGGTIDGDDLTWASEVTAPMPMKLRFKATVAGDKIDGEVITESFGAFEFQGTRA